MTYEKTPINKPLVKRKAIAKMTNDINKLSTARILGKLYKRHENDILTVVVAVQFAIIIWIKI